MHRALIYILLLPMITSCHGSKDQPSAAEEHRIQQEHERAMQQQNRLTSGEGDSMLRDEPKSKQSNASQQTPKRRSDQKSSRKSQSSAQQ